MVRRMHEAKQFANLSDTAKHAYFMHYAGKTMLDPAMYTEIDGSTELELAGVIPIRESSLDRVRLYPEINGVFQAAVDMKVIQVRIYSDNTPGVFFTLADGKVKMDEKRRVFDLLTSAAVTIPTLDYMEAEMAKTKRKKIRSFKGRK